MTNTYTYTTNTNGTTIATVVNLEEAKRELALGVIPNADFISESSIGTFSDPKKLLVALGGYTFEGYQVLEYQGVRERHNYFDRHVGYDIVTIDGKSVKLRFKAPYGVGSPLNPPKQDYTLVVKD